MRGGGRQSRSRTSTSLLPPFPASPLILNILRDIQQHRSRPAILRHVERFLHCLGQLLDVLYQPVVLGDRLGDADDVGLLKGVTAHHRPRDLTSDRDHRGVIHVRGGQAGDQIRCPGPGGGNAHASAPAGAGIAISRVSCCLLVTHQHMPQPRILGERVIERHDRAAGIAEHDVHALLQQGTAEDLCSGQRLRHRLASRCLAA